MKSEEILEVVVRAADDKLAENIVVMDVRGLTSIGDYFVVMNGRNERQMGAIAEGITQSVHKNKIPLKNQEGKDSGNWTLIDLSDVIVHIFSNDERSYYNLEKLWSDAPLVDISEWVTE
ncbi:ribosome silencing factor [Jeotgalibaca porci]|uniref:Ribosomal silencing factor RsfS n=1 Tax=Jeotgalibaca porci TaxID=1868793 RepID=A0A6G7WFR5_9LACT|nr:ribosome silencing factor [Jeotgalibaca porci]NLB99280.1 ribosome silencing factor [Lactobacillales bacterium]QIK51082.1 ribosome silencing factor [Jeotgalibaca porci]